MSWVCSHLRWMVLQAWAFSFQSFLTDTHLVTLIKLAIGWDWLPQASDCSPRGKIPCCTVEPNQHNIMFGLCQQMKRAHNSMDTALVQTRRATAREKHKDQAEKQTSQCCRAADGRRNATLSTSTFSDKTAAHEQSTLVLCTQRSNDLTAMQFASCNHPNKPPEARATTARCEPQQIDTLVLWYEGESCIHSE